MGQSRRRIKILVVDDHPLVREGLAVRINSQSNMEVCGEAGDADEALEQIKSIKPDVAIVDISLKKGNGIELIRQILAVHPDVKILVSSMHDEVHYAKRALKAGALGYIHKQESPEMVIDAVHDVLDGRIYLCPDIMRQLVHNGIKGRPGSGAAGSPVETLTDRELEILEMIGRGRTSSQIAVELAISANTVDSHRRNIRTKLGRDSGAEVVRFAIKWVLENS